MEDFNPSVETNTAETSKKFKYVWGSIILVGALVLLAVSQSLYFQFKQPSQPVVLWPQGTLYLTLENEGGVVDSYVLDIESKELSLLKDGLDGYVTFMPSVDKKSLKVAFSAAPIDLDSQHKYAFTDFLQIYVSDPSLQNTKQVSSSTLERQSFIDWNPKNDMQIAFTALHKSEEAPEDMWGVYMTDIGKQFEEIVYVGPGTNPQWLPDGRHILAIREEGLVLYDAEGQESYEIIYGFGRSGAGSGLRYTLSEKGDQIVWELSEEYNPDRFGVYLTSITNTGEVLELSQEQNRIFRGRYSWPVFSPKGDYLATLAPSQSGTLTVVIFDLMNEVALAPIDIKGFSIENTANVLPALTDWVE